MMSRILKSLVWLAGACLVLMLLAGAGLSVLFSDLCANDVFVELPSPDGQYKAVVFERNCGATTGFSTQISVLRSSLSLGNTSGNVFVADTNRGAAPSGAGGGPAVHVQWTGDRTLAVSHHPRARVYSSGSTPTFDELFEALDFVGAAQPMEHSAYLCVATGAIHYSSEALADEEPLPDDIDDEGKYIAIPHPHDLGLGRELVLRFVGEVLPDAQAEVYDCFRRRGAYGRVKGIFERRGLLQQWYEYEAKSRRDALREWCEAGGIAVRD